MLSPNSDGVTAEPSTLPTFSFAPLITVSKDGLYETGIIGGVAVMVSHSIRSQLARLAARVKDRRSPAVPGVSFRSTGCFWSWMMGSASDARWTVLSPREFTCASCFNARRACLLWLGNMKLIVLPLPPTVREAKATWEDPGYYIYQAVGVKSERYSGVWEASRKAGKG